MSIIYVVSKYGPEWNILVEAWTDPIKAAERAVELDKLLDPDNVFHSLTHHMVKPLKIRDNEITNLDCKILARDIHYKLIEKFKLPDNPLVNSQIREMLYEAFKDNAKHHIKQEKELSDGNL